MKLRAVILCALLSLGLASCAVSNGRAVEQLPASVASDCSVDVPAK